MTSREKIGLVLAASLLALGLLASVLLGPALTTLRHSAERQRGLDAQLQIMQLLRLQAQTLQAQPRTRHEDAVRLLQESVQQHLGPQAQLSLSGEQASVTIKAVTGEALARWLNDSRDRAHVLPTQARLVRSPSASMTWDGTVVLALPGR